MLLDSSAYTWYIGVQGVQGVQRVQGFKGSSDA
jgi:hypothetical protein